MRKSHLRRLLRLSLLIIFGIIPSHVIAQENPFPVLPGLENAVAFWKQIFTRYGANDVVIHDPLDPATVYTVLNVPDSEQGRAIVEKERNQIMAEYDLTEEDGRVKSQRGVKERFLAGLRTSGKYLPAMQKIFREEGVPVELTYLPLVESSFNVHARSSAGAVGMWQFMPGTGRKFLRVSDAVDERKDPFVSTRAAARLLKENFRTLGTWPLAVTAYNHGTEGVLRGVGVLGSKDLVDLIRGYQSPTFGYASKNFYAEFLAALEVAKNRATYFPKLQLHRPIVFAELEVRRGLPVHSLLEPAGISHAKFLEWNPALSPALKHLPAGIRVNAPPETAKRLAAAYRRWVAGGQVTRASGASKTKAKPQIYHRVARGETLYHIARKYRTSLAAIRQANGLADHHALMAGQQLRIPKS